MQDCATYRRTTGSLVIGEEPVASLHEIRQNNPARLPAVDWVWPGAARILRGTKQIIAGDTVVTVPAGGLLWLPGAMRADVRNLPQEGFYHAEVLFLSPALLGRISHAPGGKPESFVRPIPSPSGTMQEAWKRAAEGLREGLPASVAAFRLLELLAWIQMAGICVLPAQPSLRMRLLDRISREPGKTWRLGDLAYESAMSEDTLARRLAEEGTSFRALVQEARLTKALFLLQTTDQAVGRVSEDVGYASMSRFSARFRARFGMKPSEVR